MVDESDGALPIPATDDLPVQRDDRANRELAQPETPFGFAQRRRHELAVVPVAHDEWDAVRAG
jgi:hypothetical protein